MDVDFQWNNIVIGGTIEALTFALKNNYHVLVGSFPTIHSYEKYSNPDYDTLENEWADKAHSLYNKTLNPFVNLVDKLRVDQEEKIISVFTNTNKTYKIGYDNLHVFDVRNVSGLEDKYELSLIGYRVLDWFDATKVGAIKLEEIITEDKFVSKITFFNNIRIDGDRGYKDLVSESFLTENQLKNFEFSDTMARFKTLDILKRYGLNSVNLVLWKRDVSPVYERLV
tara:strand:- start:921 stop:1598 length:678 start_codon:yes stop_codon:yes gene_type:complete